MSSPTNLTVSSKIVSLSTAPILFAPHVKTPAARALERPSRPGGDRAYLIDSEGVDEFHLLVGPDAITHAAFSSQRILTA